MAVFMYKALDTGRLAVSGTVAADTPRQARDMLRARGLTIQKIVRQKAAMNFKWWPGSVSRRHTAQVVSFVRELSTLLGVGIPMLEAIDTIAKQHHGGFQSVLLIIRDRVAAGLSLAQAMAEHPMIFDELCVSITEVGQSAGTLETALERLAQFKERSMQLKNRVGTALMYPCMVLLTGVAVSIFLMTFVVPNLLDVLAETGRPLPLATRAVKAVSDTLLGWWWLLGFAAIGLVSTFGLATRSPSGRWFFDRLILRVPIVGDIARKQAIVRIALVVSTLMRSGIVFVKAIQIAQNTTRNLVLRHALKCCEQAVYAGRDIAEALKDTGVFPPLVVQLFAAGQRSGRLEEMLDRLVIDYDQQVATASGRLASILEPALILVLAVIVGFIAFATFMPILEAGDVL